MVRTAVARPGNGTGCFTRSSCRGVCLTGSRVCASPSPLPHPRTRFRALPFLHTVGHRSPRCCAHQPAAVGGSKAACCVRAQQSEKSDDAGQAGIHDRLLPSVVSASVWCTPGVGGGGRQQGWTSIPPPPPQFTKSTTKTAGALPGGGGDKLSFCIV